MSQNLYIAGNNEGVFAPYSPATFKGSWDILPTAADRLLLPSLKVGQSTEVTRAETSATTPLRVCILRAVSPGLAAGSLAGTLDMIQGIRESNAAADFFTKIYAYFTQGDSDAVRVVALDYEESSGGGGTEWPTTNLGRALQAAQSLAAGSWLDGDRLIIEFGYRAENSSTTSRTGGLRIGGRGSDLSPLADLTVGASGSSGAGYFVLSALTLALASNEPTNFTPETAIDMGALPYDSGNFDVVSATYALFWKHTGEAGDNGAIGTFAGVSDASGAYVPEMFAWKDDGAAWATYFGGIAVPWGAYTLKADIGSVLLLQVSGSPSSTPPAGAPGRDLRLTAIGNPTQPGDLTDQYLITEDVIGSNFPPLASVIDADTGAILTLKELVNSEHGAVLDNGIWAVSDLGGNGSPTTDEVVIYNLDLTQRAATSGVGTGSGQISMTTDGTAFYSAQRDGLTDIRVCKIDQDGNIVDTWTIPLPSGWASTITIGVSRDGLTLYYATGGVANEPVKRWDLGADSALPDFLPGIPGATVGNIVGLRDGTILIQTTDGAVGTVRQYDAAAAVLNTYTFSDPFSPSSGTAFIDHIATTPNDPLEFAIWFQQESPVDSHYFDFVFARVDVATGALSRVVPNVYNIRNGTLTPQADLDVPATYFGASHCCPLLVLGARIEPATLIIIKETDPPGSGQLFTVNVASGLSPSTFQTQDGQTDTYENVAPGTYSVIEDPVDGWTTTYDVTGGDPNDAIVLGPGETKTVRILNSFGACPGIAGPPPQDGIPYNWPY